MSGKRTIHWAAGLTAAALLIAARFLPAAEWQDPCRDRFADSGLSGMLLYSLAGTAAVLLFVPVSIPVIAAGLFFGFPGGLLPAAAILAASSSLGFATGRALRPRIDRLPAFNRPTVRAIRRAFEEKHLLLLAGLRMTPVMHFMTANLFFGSLRIRFGSYLAASLLGMVPGTLLLVYSGSMASSLTRRTEQTSAAEWILFGVGLLVLIVISRTVTRRVRSHLQAPDGDRSTCSAR